MLGGNESGTVTGMLSESTASATELTATIARLKNVKSFVERRVREDLIDFLKIV